MTQLYAVFPRVKVKVKGKGVRDTVKFSYSMCISLSCISGHV